MSQFSTHELLEMASLDVLGLLDADEREAFERSFRAAPPELQAQIRREQLRAAGFDSVLPSVEPPLGLRARVLAALRDAMQSTARAAGRAEVAGRIVPEVARAYSVNRWWRTAAIGSMAAALVFGFSTLQLKSDNELMVDGTKGNLMSDVFRQDFGPRFEQAFFNPNSRFVQFAPAAIPAVDGDTSTKAMLVIDPETKKGQLFLKNLSSARGEYSLVIVDEQGTVARAVLDFTGTGATIEKQDIKLDLEGVSGLAIIETTSGKSNTLLKSRI